MPHDILKNAELRGTLPDYSYPRFVGCATTSCARLMLPIWDSFCPSDVDFGKTVAAMDAWVTSPSPATVANVGNWLQRIGQIPPPRALPHLSMPVGVDWPARPEPNINKRPGEYAGDSIVAAANYIFEMDKPDQWACAFGCIDAALDAISYLLAERMHEDTDAPICQLAADRLTEGLLTQLKSIAIDAT